MAEESYDAVVVGSGYGGSVAAFRMAMAGIRVCLIEKGRRWEANDFPEHVFGLISTVRVESRRLGFGLGSKKALFQVHDQGDSVAAVACGLGGGSLVNAGVIVPTPARVKKDPRWPKEWNKDWDLYEQFASSMLGAQSIPVEFPNARVMKQIAEEEIEDCRPDPIKLSINFGQGSQQTESCLACGNCLSGCPYNAKNSTDKNYLASAIQDGCVVKTERRVLYILKNPDINFEEDNGAEQSRRWRVYFDDLEYITADFVVLSAGVLGTSEIFFQSKRRGLDLSERLGLGLSCNGNNVAYVAGSQAPLHGYGLTKKHFLGIPFQNRPGPAISSSFTSSLGFTIQSGVVPRSYPYLLFKGVTTYGWPNGFSFLHGLIDKLKHVMGFKASEAVVLNAMGYDACNGIITLDEETEKICVTPPHDPLLPKKILAFQNITKKLGGILFMSRYRSTTVHLLGGCNAASDASNGVCNPKGQVFYTNGAKDLVHKGLYVCDASLIPCSIGINPCLTITTVAEQVSRNLVQDVLNFKGTIQHLQTIESTDSHSISEKLTMRTCEKVTVKETMRGFIGGMPCTAYIVLKMNSLDKDNCDQNDSVVGDTQYLLKGRVGGYVVFQAVNKDKLYIVDGKVDMCKIDARTPYTQYMHYRLILAASSGSRYIFEGQKVMNPYLLAMYGFKESTTLHVSFRTLPTNDSEVLINLRGELHISVFELVKSFWRLEGKYSWEFVRSLLQSLWRTYILQIPRQIKCDVGLSDTIEIPYPPSAVHELKTEDGCTISCQQWKCYARNSEEEKIRYPVLLLNGHSGESYCLPTEKTDLVRTLLEEGHETWLLRPRLHPSHPSNNFTIEDIGKFDIPSVIKQILGMNGPNAKIHVIAHCVGGLAIHIALLGGHISATHIASLSCTNSSMYFKLTTSALVKMWLPLIPITMALLGKNRTLSLHISKDSLRHKLVKSIAKLIPRNERCTCNVCEIISGIFGNPFWHANISNTMHHWLNKQSQPKLPLSAFPHLRRICTSGFIVDSKGKNKYLIHPERMPLPTLYISGGRSLLVTPQTTLLANKFMRLHQPGFHHKRIVVEDFGHSDLLIGEESHKRVFPHFISHMKLAEAGVKKEVTDSRKEIVLSWDGSHDGTGLLGDWSSFIDLLFLLFIIAVVIFLF
ncbi:uncharacterized protein A4U43_C04F7050 [Asparagus officinalis]|uniref:Cholesterol oxidase n=1 Tax=Asparagus officinalis TaxID=4686 RepID=A0A5P1F4B4_ASPOF|nr:uncharacterized protein LOC109836787 [Asparagus officinalis]ONK71300.1 uncharacterized protein A4U43_C04F7050 [Asparagus officinalis]